MTELGWETMEYTGTLPQPSFGHTVTQISKTKILLFGGAVGDSGKYAMTDATYIYYLFKSSWTKLESTFAYPIGSHRNQAFTKGGTRFGGCQRVQDGGIRRGYRQYVC